jgi:hypothetical protein
MDYKRYKRLRVLIHRVNKERKKQAKKIDILCNDFIAAQKDFIKRLDAISFTANFYESIVGTGDLNELLYTAGKLIQEEIADSNVAFFLRQTEGFKLHIFEGNGETGEQQHIENFFTAELVDNICKSNKPCALNSLPAMGLEGNLGLLNKISAVTIPLSHLGSSLGFILIYRSVQNKLTESELNNICAVTRGLSQAIASCQTLCHSVD